jgi:DNA-binding LytR/AlgR family response regulator
VKRRQPPLAILIVEDEALLAMGIEAMVEDAGHHVMGEAASLFEVEDMSNAVAPDLAFVDIQLPLGTSGLDVSRAIQRKWPGTFIVFVTANQRRFPMTSSAHTA